MNPVLWFFVVLVVFTAVIQLIVFWMMILFDDATQANTPPQPPIAKERLQLPENIHEIPAPRLQTKEALDLKTLEDRDVAKLTRYSVNKLPSGKQTIRIPIQRAMDLLAERNSMPRDSKKKAEDE